MIKPKMIIADQGYSEIAPENTQLAFDAAYLFGFDGLKITVQQSKDQKLVLSDYESIDDIAKNKEQISNLTLAELEKLNLATYFNKFFPKQTILTYKEFLIMYGKKFKIIIVEIKTDIVQYQNIEAKLLEVHRQIRPKAQIIYASKNLRSLKIMRKLSSQIELGFIFKNKQALKPIVNEVKAICQYLHPWFNSFNEVSDLSYYQKLKLPLNVWTFDQRHTDDHWTKNSYKIVAKLKVMPEIMCLISKSKF